MHVNAFYIKEFQMIKKLEVGSWMRTSWKEFKKYWPTVFGLCLIYTGIIAVTLHLLVTKITPIAVQEAGFDFLTVLSYFPLSHGYNVDWFSTTHFFDEGGVSFEVWSFLYAIISMVSMYVLTTVVWDILKRRPLQAYLFGAVIKGTLWFLVGIGGWVISISVIGSLVSQVIVAFTQAGYPTVGKTFLLVFLFSLCFLIVRSIFYSWALVEGADNTLVAVRRSFIATRGNFWRIVVAFMLLYFVSLIVMSVSGAIAFELSSVSEIGCLIWRIISNSFSTVIFLISPK
jgi:hypothetical protein